MAKFDWAKMYKAEEYIEREAYSCVESAIIDLPKLSKSIGIIMTKVNNATLVSFSLSSLKIKNMTVASRAVSTANKRAIKTISSIHIFE